MSALIQQMSTLTEPSCNLPVFCRVELRRTGGSIDKGNGWTLKIKNILKMLNIKINSDLIAHCHPPENQISMAQQISKNFFANYILCRECP